MNVENRVDVYFCSRGNSCVRNLQMIILLVINQYKGTILLLAFYVVFSRNLLQCTVYLGSHYLKYIMVHTFKGERHQAQVLISTGLMLKNIRSVCPSLTF